MRAPTLRQVESDLERIRSMTPKLADAAKWAWPLAYARLDRGGQAGRVAGDVARPVEAVLATAGAPEVEIRNEVGRAGILIGRAVELLEAATGCLARAHAAADVGPHLVDAGPGRPMLTKAELAAATSAKARRDALRPTGTGYGVD